MTKGNALPSKGKIPNGGRFFALNCAGKFGTSQWGGWPGRAPISLRLLSPNLTIIKVSGSESM